MSKEKIKFIDLDNLEKVINDLIKNTEMLYIDSNSYGFNTKEFTDKFFFHFYYDEFILITQNTDYKFSKEWIKEIYLIDEELKIVFENNTKITITPVK